MVKFPSRWRRKFLKALERKHSSGTQGPFALRCAVFGLNSVAPMETCLFAGDPFQRRDSTTHNATVG